MHPRIYQEFERICRQHAAGGSVLEVGAIPSKESLLCLPALDKAVEKIGLNMDGPYEFENFRILRGDVNSMTCFEDNRFDVVLCNATLEHDKYFWKSVAELKRVTKPGGLLVIGLPGFTRSWVDKIQELLGRLPLLHRLNKTHHFDTLFNATLTFRVHNAPGDYYRFSQQAFKEVILAGMENVHVESVMYLPRVIGWGTKAI